MGYLVSGGIVLFILYVWRVIAYRKEIVKAADASRNNGEKLKSLEDEEAKILEELSKIEASKDVAEDNSLNSSRELCNEVRALAQKYNKPFFFVTDGASVCVNNGNDAVRNARIAHIEWENKRGLDSTEDWTEEVK